MGLRIEAHPLLDGGDGAVGDGGDALGALAQDGGEVSRVGGDFAIALLERFEVGDRHFGHLFLEGRVHPLLLSPLALTRMGELYGFAVRCYSSPYNVQEIAKETLGKLTGDELLIIGTLNTVTA